MSMFRGMLLHHSSPRFRKELFSTCLFATVTISSNLREPTESIRSIGRWIAKWLRARHHVRQQTSGNGAKRQTPMRMTDSQPQTGQLGGAADHRSRIRKTRPAADPGFVIGALAKRK